MQWYKKSHSLLIFNNGWQLSCSRWRPRQSPPPTPLEQSCRTVHDIRLSTPCMQEDTAPQQCVRHSLLQPHLLYSVHVCKTGQSVQANRFSFHNAPDPLRLLKRSIVSAYYLTQKPSAAALLCSSRLLSALCMQRVHHHICSFSARYDAHQGRLCGRKPPGCSCYLLKCRSAAATVPPVGRMPLYQKCIRQHPQCIKSVAVASRSCRKDKYVFGAGYIVD